MIRFENLAYSYPGRSCGLREISITIEKGSLIFLYAPTSEYKTTFLNLIYGEILPDSGKLHIFEYILPDDRKKISKIRKKIGYAFHPFYFFEELTVRENLLISLMIKEPAKKIKEHEKYIDEIIQKYSNLNPIQYVKNLSYTEKQVLNIVRALVGDPVLLLFDDPFKHLDKDEIDRWIKTFMEKTLTGVTIITTISNPSISEKYEIKTYFLKNGRLLEKNEK